MKKPIRLFKICSKVALLVLAVTFCVFNAHAQTGPLLTGTENPDPNYENGYPDIIDPNYNLSDQLGVHITGIKLVLQNQASSTLSLSDFAPKDITLTSDTTPGSYTLSSSVPLYTGDYQIALQNLQYASTLSTNAINIFITDDAGHTTEYIQNIDEGIPLSGIVPSTYIASTNIIGSTSATVEIEIYRTDPSNPSAYLTACGVVYMPYQPDIYPKLSNASDLALIPGGSGGDISLTGLQPNTEYIASAYATNSFGTYYSPSITFTTISYNPIITATATENNPTIVITNNYPVTVDPGVTISDSGSTNLTSITLYPPDGATLTVPGPLPASLTFSDNVLSGTATVAQYQAALRTLQIATASYYPGPEDIYLTVVDATGITGNGTLSIETKSQDADATLRNLILNGATISPAFSPSTYTYTATTSLFNPFITVIQDDSLQTIRVNGDILTSNIAIPLSVHNASNLLKITVTAGDGVTVKTYTVTIHNTNADNTVLEGLQMNPNSKITLVSSDPEQINYTASVAASTTSVKIKPTASDPGVTITVNGQPVADSTWSQPITLNTGGTPTIITTLVTTDGGKQRGYVISVSKNGSSNVILEGLQLDPNSTLTQTSSTATQINYTASVSVSTTGVKIKPTASDTTASITVNGQAVHSGDLSQTITLNTDGTPTIVTTVVTSGDGTQKSYVVSISKNGSSDVILEGLSVSQCSALTETSSTASQINYSTMMQSTIADSVMVHPIASDTTAIITVDGQTVQSGKWSQAIALNTDGTPTIVTVVVTSGNGTQKSYVISITKAAGKTMALLPVEPLRLQLITDVVVHHAVTPDGDGINDYLKIDGIEQYSDNKLAVIDPSGVLIYQTKGYDNNARKFDGHSNINGKMLQPGTYYYLLDYTVNGISARKTGYFVLQY